MAIPRNLANFANTLNTDGQTPKIQVGDSSVAITDTGSNGTITLTTDNTERMRITSSGKVGINVTPSAWDTSTSASVLQVKNSSIFDYIGAQLDVGLNTYFDGSLYKRIATLAASRYTQTGGVHIWDYAASDTAGTTITWTERARIPSTGGFQCVNSISVGNATPTTSGAGITFPATQSASTNANTLDDYEEGLADFTVSASGGGTFSSYNSYCYYIKIGKQVIISGMFQFTQSAASGDLTFSGLPYAAGSGLYFGGCANGGGYNSADKNYVMGIQGASTTSFVLVRPTDINSLANVTAADVNGSSSIAQIYGIVLIYFTA